MSDNIKIIIELPKTTYQEVIENRDTSNTNIYTAIANGTPLDSVKAEIQDLYVGYRHGYEIMADILKILDNIGKAESEDKE